jgi:hypothetical protein
MVANAGGKMKRRSAQATDAVVGVLAAVKSQNAAKPIWQPDNLTFEFVNGQVKTVHKL